MNGATLIGDKHLGRFSHAVNEVLVEPRDEPA